MNFIKKLFSPPRRTGTFFPFSVKCNCCGETIPGRVNVNNEPSVEMDEKGKLIYTCRKVLIGGGRCFQQVEVIFKFDERRAVIDRKITGGEFVDGQS